MAEPRRFRTRLMTAALAALALALVVAVPAGARAHPAGSGAVARLQATGASAIARRESALTTMAGQVSAAPACDTGGKVAGVIAADGPALTALGQKLAGETTAAAAKADVESIYLTYRVYKVVAPQAYATAACGHIASVAGTLTSDYIKLNARVEAAAAAGATMASAQASLATLETDMTTATSESNSAQAAIAALVPDQGNATIEAKNATEVATARQQMMGARRDLQDAIKAARAVVADLKAAA